MAVSLNIGISLNGSIATDIGITIYLKIFIQMAVALDVSIAFNGSVPTNVGVAVYLKVLIQMCIIFYVQRAVNNGVLQVGIAFHSQVTFDQLVATYFHVFLKDSIIGNSQSPVNNGILQIGVPVYLQVALQMAVAVHVEVSADVRVAFGLNGGKFGVLVKHDFDLCIAVTILGNFRFDVFPFVFPVVFASAAQEGYLGAELGNGVITGVGAKGQAGINDILQGVIQSSEILGNIVIFFDIVPVAVQRTDLVI